MQTRNPGPESPESTHRVLEVELLALDLTSCTRCTGTLANIEEAIAAVERVAGPTGTSIRLKRTLIDSEEAARRHRFVSSPTIRVAGRDIVFETRESLCDSCTDLCGCAEGTSCRVWSYHGREFTEAPVGLVVEALLREMAGPPAEEETCCAPARKASCCAPARAAVSCGCA
jgi:hypothetical protein